MFLRIAVIAALGGTLAVVLSIGFPLWARSRGSNVTPVFSLFAAWGFAALAGSYACIRTYLLSGDPKPPPRGGVRLTVTQSTDARAAARDRPQDRDDLAA